MKALKLKVWVLIDPSLVTFDLIDVFERSGGRFFEWPAASFEATVESLKTQGFRGEVERPFPRKHDRDFLDIAMCQHFKNITGQTSLFVNPVKPRSQLLPIIRDSDGYINYFNQWCECESVDSLSGLLGIGDDVMVPSPDGTGAIVRITPAVYLTPFAENIPINILQNLTGRVVNIKGDDIQDKDPDNVIKFIASKISQ